MEMVMTGRLARKKFRRRGTIDDWNRKLVEGSNGGGEA